MRLRPGAFHKIRKGRDRMYKILIADDEELIRALIAKYAKFEGYETEEARDGM